MAMMRVRSLLVMALLAVLSGSAIGLLWMAAQDPSEPEPVLAATAATTPATTTTATATATAEDDPSNPPVEPPSPSAAADPAPGSDAALDAQAAMLPAPLSGVRLARQSLKRSGLGSRVRATFTVRNRHDYAIKDVEIVCAFRGRDGYVTQRRHVLPDVIEGRSRETFSNVLVGHINVTTTRGRCKLLGAARA